MGGDEGARRILVGQILRIQRLGHLRAVAVEEDLGVGGQRVRRLHHRRVPVVSREDLVGALAALHHLHMLGDLLRQQEETDGVVADHRFGHRPHAVLKGGQGAVAVDEQLVVVGLEALGDQVGILELVALLLAHRLEADGEGLQAGLPGLRQQGDDDRAVQPARQQHADRHVGDQTPFHRLAQRGQHGVLPVALRHPLVAGLRAEDRFPIGFLDAAPVRLQGQQGGRRQLAHALQDGPRRRHDGVEAHVLVEPDRVDRGVDVAAGQQGGQG